MRMTETPLPVWTIAEGPTPTPPEIVGVRFLRYGSVTNVPANIETTILTYTPPPTSEKLVITCWQVSGSLDGEFLLKIDDVTKMGIRTSSAKRTESFNGNVDCGIEIYNNETLKINVTHYEIGKLGSFYTTVIGRLK